MINREVNNPTPYIMERDEAAAFLGMTEKELMLRSKEPGFPRHSGYWGRWWFSVAALTKWKAEQRKVTAQLELTDLIERKPAQGLAPELARELAAMERRLQAQVVAEVTAKLFHRTRRHAAQA